jgi:hypothetical protein
MLYSNGNSYLKKIYLSSLFSSLAAGKGFYGKGVFSKTHGYGLV